MASVPFDHKCPCSKGKRTVVEQDGTTHPCHTDCLVYYEKAVKDQKAAINQNKLMGGST